MNALRRYFAPGSTPPMPHCDGDLVRFADIEPALRDADRFAWVLPIISGKGGVDPGAAPNGGAGHRPAARQDGLRTGGLCSGEVCDMSGTRTLSLEEGKYEVSCDEQGLMTSMRRNCEPWPEGFAAFAHAKVFHAALNEIERLRAPIDMVLHCPACGLQHIDAPDTGYDPHYEGHMIWANPPHRSHLCKGCGHIWRPADVATNGVREVKTKGKSDSAPPATVRCAA